MASNEKTACYLQLTKLAVEVSCLLGVTLLRVFFLADTLRRSSKSCKYCKSNTVTGHIPGYSGRETQIYSKCCGCQKSKEHKPEHDVYKLICFRGKVIHRAHGFQTIPSDDVGSAMHVD